MILVRLEISNFLSYREKVSLDFGSIHTACISGANGAGKSSILDAITWSLFGKSRTRSDDDIINRRAIRDGEGAEVRFTFRLEGDTYRVIRRKRLGKATRLELQMEVGEDQWKSLSENRLRETESEIVDLLRLNYDTFINASFLLQGQADEFTTKTPGKRKQILSELIGASQWDAYKDMAAERRKQVEGEVTLLESRIADIDEEMGESDERAESLSSAEAEHAQIKERLADKEKLQTQLRRQQEATRHQKQQVHNLNLTLGRIKQSLSAVCKRHEERQQERKVHAALLVQSEAIQADYERWQDVDAEWQAWGAKEKQFRGVERQQQPHRLAIAQAESRLQQRVENLKQQEAQASAMGQEREQVEKKLAGLQSEQKELQARLENMALTEVELQAARATLQELAGERKLKEQDAARLRKEAVQAETAGKEQETLAGNLKDAGQSIEQLQKELASLSEENNRLMQARADLDSAKAEQPRLKEAMDKLKERIDRLQDETGGECPLCGQPLSEEHRQTVLEELNIDGKEKGERYRANRERIAALSSQIADLERAVRKLPVVERDLQAQQAREAKLQAQLEEIERQLNRWQAEGAPRLAELQSALEEDSAWEGQQAAVKALEGSLKDKAGVEKKREQVRQQKSAAEARISEIERVVTNWQEQGVAELAAAQAELETESYAQEARSALSALEEEAAAVGYDTEAHATVETSRKELAQANEQYQKLKQSEAAVKPLDDALADLAAQIEEQQAQVKALEEQHETEQARLAEMEANLEELQGVEKEVIALREAEIAASQMVGRARQMVDVLEDLRERRDEFVNQKAEKNRLVGRLRLLEKACGRDGVQALLIEQALPEIEDYANDILERLSDGQMMVSFASQRQLKSRDELAETLDIHIIDGAGERPYENYSGGEQFRVNFAIRLALSKLLARRAGARLQTLVIDEGFGSQDPQGRQRLVEAIHTVQDDFACLLVITHVDELRDAFDTRIEVVKSPAGSMITVS